MSFYKVVSIRDGQKVSICQSPSFPDEYRATYAEGVKTLPPVEGASLFVFGNLESCLDFVDSNYFGRHEIWECEVENPRPVEYIAIPMDVDNYWQLIKEAGSFHLEENMSDESRWLFDRQALVGENRRAFLQPTVNGSFHVDSVTLTVEYDRAKDE